ncbi:hypothetical protein V1293_003594 [Bradyrhizobium sp. AZCC 1693]
MRIYILLAVVVVLTGVSAESFAGTDAPQRQVAKRSDNQSATANAVRPQVRKLLTNSPAYRPL